MKRWMNAIGLTAAMGTITAMVVMQACSRPLAEARSRNLVIADDSQKSSGARYDAGTRPQEAHDAWSPIALQQSSGGLFDPTPPRIAVNESSTGKFTLGEQVFGGNTALPDSDGAQQIDLAGALNSNAGGGKGQSPFRESGD